MDLKNTKATVLKFTKKPSKPLARPLTTESPSGELKSSCERHQTGWKAEKTVLNLLKRQGFRFVAQRLKTPYSEVDLLVFKKNQIFLIEVKSSRYFTYLSSRQEEALRQSLSYLQGCYEGQSIRAILALVEGRKVSFIPDFL